ncbi:glycosyltransferase [Salinimicrobium soli]|uniref:glycosyltransferase n=1 Tax=Salinimicrobium soli TaxID=1254399 RepID=UPI003AB05C18
MRVLQLIDSLHSGGAERMAVNYANALESRVEGSFLCCTRSEGLLKEKLNPSVGFLFLKKKATLDFRALFRLRNYILKNDIDLIQAHGTSWFFAALVKMTCPKLKLVWHDHYGKELKDRKTGVLYVFSNIFNGIISVNTELKDWAIEKLRAKNVIYVTNFLAEQNCSGEIFLKGKGTFNLLCIANFRPQKDHINLLKAFKLAFINKPDVSLHLVGKFEEGPYYDEIKKYLLDNEMENKVYLYGEQKDVKQFLKQAQLGVLSSKSEGLPLALLEYGLNALPVVCTAVGECPEVLGNCGILVEPGKPKALAEAMNFYYHNLLARDKDRICFERKVKNNYTEGKVVSEVIRFFATLTTKKGRI